MSHTETIDLYESEFMKVFLIVLSLLSCCTSMVYAQSNNFMAVQTTVKNGVIEGNYNVTNGISTYFGIPFAKPPVGDLRWKAPVPADKWSGIKITKKFGPRPVQGLVFGDMNSWSDGVSEDCLT